MVGGGKLVHNQAAAGLRTTSQRPWWAAGSSALRHAGRTGPRHFHQHRTRPSLPCIAAAPGASYRRKHRLQRRSRPAGRPVPRQPRVTRTGGPQARSPEVGGRWSAPSPSASSDDTWALCPAPDLQHEFRSRLPPRPRQVEVLHRFVVPPADQGWRGAHLMHTVGWRTTGAPGRRTDFAPFVGDDR